MGREVHVNCCETAKMRQEETLIKYFINSLPCRTRLLLGLLACGTINFPFKNHAPPSRKQICESTPGNWINPPPPKSRPSCNLAISLASTLTCVLTEIQIISCREWLMAHMFYFRVAYRLPQQFRKVGGLIGAGANEKWGKFMHESSGFLTCLMQIFFNIFIWTCLR